MPNEIHTGIGFRYEPLTLTHDMTVEQLQAELAKLPPKAKLDALFNAVKAGNTFSTATIDGTSVRVPVEVARGSGFHNPP